MNEKKHPNQDQSGGETFDEKQGRKADNAAEKKQDHQTGPTRGRGTDKQGKE